MDKKEVLKEIIQNKKERSHKQPKYGMRKLSVGVVSCVLGFVVFSSNNIICASENTSNLENTMLLNKEVGDENREVIDIREQPISITANRVLNIVNTKNNAGLSSNLVEEIKNINFTDEELTNTLGVTVTISDGYMINGIKMANQEGKTWTKLSDEEKNSYFEKAKADIKAEKLSGNVYQNEFNTIKQDVNSYISKYDITSASDSLVSNNKHQFVLGLAYFEKLYNIPIENGSTTTLKDKLFEGLAEDVLVKNIIDIGSKLDKDISYKNISNLYKNNIANQFTSQATLDSFIKESVSGNKVDDWFEKSLKIINYIDPDLEGGVFNKFAKSASTLNHILPLLNLEKDTIYMIATEGSITYGLYDTYVTKKSKNQSIEEKALEAKVNEIGEAQKKHIDIWQELSGGKTPNKNTIVKDALRIKKEAEDPYKVESNYTSSNSWAGKYDTDGLKEFITPLDMYSSYINAGAVAETPDIRMYINRALDYRGLSAYSHEMIHLYTTEYLLGNKQRVDTQVELLPRGLLESLENDEAIFGLNLIYENRKYTNTSYDRFKSGSIASDIQSYMNKQMDLIYSLEIIEANEILKRGDKTNFFMKLSQEPTPDTALIKNNTQTTDTFSSFTDNSIASIEDLVDKNLVVSRYYYQKTKEDSNKALNNGYHTIPLFSSFYAAPQNDKGTVGDVSLRRMAFELLAEYGYENGLVAYLSNKYPNDAEAVKGIFKSSYGSMAEFKKAMYQRREDKINDLDDVSFVYDGKNYTQKDINNLMAQAIQADSTNPSNYRTSKVEDLKEAVFLAYKQKTNDFTEDIYKDKVQESKDIYVKNGQVTSIDGQGTEKVPYESLIHAISKAKDGDRIIFVDSIVLTGNSDLVIDKNITIDGKGNSLTLRGQDIVLKSDTIMKDIKVGFAQDGSSDVGKIYVNDKKIILDNVSTKLGENPNQSDIRPVLVAGGKTSDLNDEDGAIIQIINATGETRFKEIILGNESGTKSSSTKLEIGENVIVDDKVNLSSADGSKTSGEISIINSSSKVKSFLGGKNADNVKIEISSGVNIYNLKLDKIESLTLNKNSTASLEKNVDSESLEIKSLVIEEGSMLNLNASSSTNISNGNINGRLTINPVKNKLIVSENLSGIGTIMIDAGNGVFSNEILNKDIIITEKPQVETLRGEFTTNGQNYSLVKKDSGYQIAKEKAKQAETIFINLILDRDGDLNTKEVDSDYDNLYVGDQIETPYIDKSADSYIPVIMKDVNLKEYLLLPLSDNLNPIITGEDDTIDFMNFWVAKPGNLIIDGKKKPFNISIENGKQIVSYTVEKPESGYYKLEDGTKFDENNYGKSIVVTKPEKDLILTLVEEKNTVSEEIRKEIIPQPEDKIVYDASKVAGTQDLIVEGEAGEKEITEKVTRNSKGDIIKKEFVSEKIIKEARPKVITKYIGKTEVENTEITTKVEDINFETEYVANPDLEYGKQQEKTPGQNGKRTIKIKDGQEISNEITTSPVNRVIEVGNKKVITSEVNFVVERVENKSKLETEVETIKKVGEKGLDTITITYEVDLKTGNLTEKTLDKVRTKEPVNQVVEYGTKKLIIEVEDKEFTEKQEIRKESIPQPEDKIVYDASKVAGTQDLIIEGEAGEKEITEKVTRNSKGDIIKKEFISEKIIKEARPKVITIYTGKTEVENTEITTKIEDINFETEYIANPDLEYGKQQEKTPGQNGKRTIKIKDGKEISNEITTSPIKRIIEVGNKKVITREVDSNVETIENDSKLETIKKEGEKVLDIITITYEVDLKTGVVTEKILNIVHSKEPVKQVDEYDNEKSTIDVEDKEYTKTQETRIEVIEQPEDEIIYDSSKPVGTPDTVKKGQVGKKEITEIITRDKNGQVINVEFITENEILPATANKVIKYNGLNVVEEQNLTEAKVEDDKKLEQLDGNEDEVNKNNNTNKVEIESNPNTGDVTSINHFLGTVLLSLGGLVTLRRRKKN